MQHGQRGQRAGADRFGVLALLAVVCFALTALVLQWLRTDLDPWRAPLSFYLLGRDSQWLVAAYWVLAAGLLALGIGYRRALAGIAGRDLSSLLFVVGGLALALVTVFDTDVQGRAPSLHGFLHGLCAASAFLCTGVAMLSQSWCLRRAPGWRRRAWPALSLAVLAFVALWLDVFWRLPWRGAEQKAVIALYLLWLGAASWWLLRRPRYT